MKKNNIIDFIKDYGILLGIIIGPLLIFILLFIFSTPGTKMNVHWHMPLSYNLCGDTTQLKDEFKEGLLHGHNDGKIHLEGAIDPKNRKETLAMFFANTQIIFSKTQIGKYKNGDTCKGSKTPGKVSMSVNGKENTQFENYILNDDDKIKIIFK